MTFSPVDSALEHARQLHRAGRLAEAAGAYRQILAQFPYCADAWHLLGVANLDGGYCAEARELIRKAINLDPSRAAYFSDLGLTYQRQGNPAEALPCFQRALSLQPGLAIAHYNLGRTLRDLGRGDEAIASYRNALTLRPDFVEAWNNLGNALSDRGDHEAALECFGRVPLHHPALAEARCNLANTLLEMGRLEESVAASRVALVLNPGLAKAHSNLGTALYRQGHYDEAEACYRQALSGEPGFAEAHWGLGLLLLLSGRFEEGWKEYEWRPLSPRGAGPDSIFARPRWDGSPIPGQTLLLHAEQGFGDTIQFLRYVPLVVGQAQAARVIVAVQPELRRLLESVEGLNAEVIVRGETEASWPACDQHLPLLSLPLALRRFEPLAMDAPYLEADPALCEVWRARLGSSETLRVGLAWEGNRGHKHAPYRAIGTEKILRLLQVPGATFYSLQLGADPGETARLQEAGLIDHTGQLHDFADTAALMAELDLVICVDTAVAHLAGALGRPVWVLLSSVTDYRWGLRSESTPWYPTLALFRQAVLGDWDSVVETVAEELGLFLRLGRE